MLKNMMSGTMNFEELLTMILTATAVLIIGAAALLIWATVLLLRIRDIERRLNPLRTRDGTGRPFHERF